MYIGKEASDKWSILNLEYPIEHGIVNNWDDLEKIFQYIFKTGLHEDPSKHPILMSEVMINTNHNREKMAQLMFETFKVPSFYLCEQGLLSLIASDKDTGLVVNSGDGITDCVAIYEGFRITQSVKTVDFAGSDVTDYFQLMLTKLGHKNLDRQTINDIKEKTGYVAIDYEKELQNARTSNVCDTSYQSRGTKLITLGEERFRGPELLFKPYLNGIEMEGVDKMIFNSIQKSDDAVQKSLFQNIVLSGGNTMFNGFTQRLEKELKELAPPTIDVAIYAQKCMFANFIGGTKFAANDVFNNVAIKSSEYNESGPRIIHKKCFN